MGRGGLGVMVACLFVCVEGTFYAVPDLSLIHILPDWFAAGMRAAQLAPTAMNQQKFLITLHEGNVVSAEATGGSYSGIDLGIVRCHFELGAQAVSCEWTWK